MKKLIIIFIIFIASQVLVWGEKTTYKLYPVKEKGVHVAWDPVPKTRKFLEDSEIRYCVYIRESGSKDETAALAVNKSVQYNLWKYKDIDKEEPIADTSCTIEIPPNVGPILDIGVQTVICKKKETVICHPTIKNNYRSDIAWSINPIYTNGHPFEVTYGEK